tara:strand:+ start:5024 stop:5530 length:507 start_codon:yes stop_codon:yes gene_type:complete
MNLNGIKIQYGSKFTQSLIAWCMRFKKHRMFRLALLDVYLKNDGIELDVLVNGIKSQIIQYTPDEIIFNDSLLVEFSPCDVRAITYLSFHKYINEAYESPILIQSQQIKQGKTIFLFWNRFTTEKFQMGAIEAYQNYDLLNKINKMDMINIISTAVQEQSMQDFNNMS